MRKLKLQAQITVDGFVGGPKGELDWMTWEEDEQLKHCESELTDTFGTILLGRKMTDEFVTYWKNLLDKPNDPYYTFAKKMIDIPKVVFTKTLDESNWENTTLAKGNLVEEIKKLKDQEGKDIVVYGGASFVSNLIKENLIDEYYLFINPVAIGTGLTIFGGIGSKMNFTLIKSTEFNSGVVLHNYRPK